MYAQQIAATWTDHFYKKIRTQEKEIKYVANKISCDPKKITVWKKLLKLTFHHRNFELPSILWYLIAKTKNNLTTEWDWFCSSDNKFLFKHIKYNIWHQHLKKNNSHRTFHTEFLVVLSPPTCTLLRASAITTNSVYHLLHLSSNAAIGEQVQEIAFRFHAVVMSKPLINWLLQPLPTAQIQPPN